MLEYVNNACLVFHSDVVLPLSAILTKSITQLSLCIAALLQSASAAPCWIAVRTEGESTNPGAIFYVASNSIDSAVCKQFHPSVIFYFTRFADIDCEQSSRQYKLTLNYHQKKGKTAVSV